MLQPAMRPQDILILLAILSAALSKKEWQNKHLAEQLSISQAEISNALKRLVYCGLLTRKSDSEPQVKLLALTDFLLCGIRYVYPAVFNQIVVGIPAAYSAPPFAGQIGVEEAVVWPSAEGMVRGTALLPLYPTIPVAALKDEELYRLLAVMDVCRVGPARARNIAQAYLQGLKERL